MNTNNQNKTLKDSVSLDFQDSNLKINKGTNNSVCPLIKHKEGYQEETSNSTRQANVSCPLTFSNNKRPPNPIKIEINQLAKTWCELLLGQIQETRSRQKLQGAFEANSGENRYRNSN